VDVAAEQSDVDIEDAARKYFEHQDRIETAHRLSRQAAAATSCSSRSPEVTSCSSEGSEKEGASQEHGQAVADQVTSHRNDQGEITFHGSHPDSERRNAKRQAVREEGDPLDPGNLDKKRYCTEFHVVNERLKVTTTVTTQNVTTRVTTLGKPDTSGKQRRSMRDSQCSTGWLQAMQEHARVVEYQVASHHDGRDESSLHGSHASSKCGNTRGYATLEEGDPREELAQKKMKAEATAERQAERPGEVERSQCSSTLPHGQHSLSCQCSQTIRMIVLQEREDFPGRWKQGWCHRCSKPAPWMSTQPRI